MKFDPILPGKIMSFEVAETDPVMTHAVEFHGDAKEYFGIWIVNVLLTIVTFGIYSAWAKVRNKKYFYGNTFIDGNNFDYHATAKQILIGRIILVVALGLLAVTTLIHIALYVLALICLMLCLPWLICRAMQFNARMSSYRNVRFNFKGRTGEAFVTYFFIPIGVALTLYTTAPFLSRSRHTFIGNNHQYGDRTFFFKHDIGPYYKPFLIAVAYFILGAFIYSLLSSPLRNALYYSQEALDAAQLKLLLITYIIAFLFFFPATAYYRGAIRNHLFNGASLDGVHNPKSTVEPLAYIIIVVTNTLAAIFTIGMLIPWGRVRLARYLAENTFVESTGSLEGYASDVRESAGVISAEYADIEGFGIDIGF